jgi:antitoxin YefM
METTYETLRTDLSSIFDRVTNDHEVVIVCQRGRKAVAIISADELAGLIETADLLRSPKNARRLLDALSRAEAGTRRERKFSSSRR